MKRLDLHLLSACCLILAASAAAAVEVDGIAAKVNGTTILKSEVYSEMRRLGPRAPSYEDLRDEMVDRVLILKAAKDAKMTMQDWVVENRIREIVTRAFDGDRNQLMDQLAKERLSYAEWRKKMVDDMIVTAMRWQMIDKNVTASPAEMREEFTRHPDRYAAGRKVTVSVILLKPEDAAKRDEVSAALKTDDFAAVARRYSSGPKAAEGGLWKDVDPDESFRPEVCAEIDKMSVGALGDWIQLDGWSFLVRKDAASSAKTLSFAEAADTVEENIRMDKAKALYDAWVKRLRAAAFIRVY